MKEQLTCIQKGSTVVLAIDEPCWVIQKFRRTRVRRISVQQKVGGCGIDRLITIVSDGHIAMFRHFSHVYDPQQLR